MRKNKGENYRQKKRTIKSGLILAGLLVTGLFMTGTKQVRAMEMPTEDQIQEYKEDGSLQERIDYYNNLTEDYSQGLIADKLQEENANSRSRYPETFGAEGRMQAEGEASLLFVRVDFPDITFSESDTEEMLYNSAFAEKDETNPKYPYESLAAYYDRASYGKLKISGDVFSYTAKHERAYYGDAQQGIDRTNELYEEMLDALDEEGVDFTKYDKNNDGYLDGVYLYFAGRTTGWASVWWSVTYAGSIEDKLYDGKKIGYHVKLAEESAISLNRTMIHETGHMLGLPDYYSYKEDDFENGIRTYDMMYNVKGDFNAFSKWLLGWIEDDEILQVSLDGEEKQEQTAVLSSLSSLAENEENTYKAAVVSMENNGIFSEYYLVEYDTEQENQSGLRFKAEKSSGKLPEGFRVFHVNAELQENQDGFKYANTVAGETKLIELVDPDSSEWHVAWKSMEWLVPSSYEAGQYHCYYLKGDRLTPTTNPSTVLDDERYYGKSGISLTEFEPNGENGSLKITVEPIEQTDPSQLEVNVVDVWKEVQQSNQMIVPIELSERAKLNEDAESPYIVKKDGTKVKGNIYSCSKTKYLVTINTDEAEDGACNLILPKGTFQLGEDVYSLEECVEVTVGKNAKYEKDISMIPGILYVGGMAADGGWCVVTTNDENQNELRFIEISKDGKTSEKTIDISGWDNWNSDFWSNYRALLRLPDGSWILSEDNRYADKTLVAHMDAEGNLLGELQELPKAELELHLVGNTVKAVAKDRNGCVAQMWNLDFNGSTQEIPIEYSESHYFFFEQGYLIEHMEGTPVGYSQEEINVQQLVKMNYEWMDEKDQKLTTYQFEVGSGDTQIDVMNQLAVLEKDGILYLIGASMSDEELELGTDKYKYVNLYLNQIDEKSGQVIKKAKVNEPVRYIQTSGIYGTPKNVDASWVNDKIVLRITLDYSRAGSISDVYLLNTEGTIEQRISTNAPNWAIVSGQQILLNRYGAPGIEYKIYNFGDSQEPNTPSDPGTPGDPSNPGITDDPSNPGTTDNPSNPGTTDNPTNPGTTDNPTNPGTSAVTQGKNPTTSGGPSKTKKNSKNTDAKAAKTGDQSQIPLAAATMAAGAGIMIAVCGYQIRKKKEVE